APVWFLRLPPLRVRPDAELAQPREQLGLRRDVEARDRVREEVQVALGGRRRIVLADRARGGVAWIGEERLASLGALLVRVRERLCGQVHLAAHVDAPGDLLAERERDRLDRAEVRGHVLAGRAVAARRPLDERAVLIAEG